MDSGDISAVFAGIGALASQLGVANIRELPGCWEIQIDEQWFIAVNGHKDERRCSKGARVPFAHAYVEYNGWPAGIINPYGGILAAGDCANEQALIAAIERRIGRKIEESI